MPHAPRTVRNAPRATCTEVTRSLMADLAPVVVGQLDREERLVDLDGALLGRPQPPERARTVIADWQPVRPLA